MFSGSQASPDQRRAPPRVRAILIAWLGMIGVDLFLHAGLLAPLYDWDSPFLLPPEQAFIRIPAGYVAFLILAAGLYWLLARIDVHDGRRGAVLGAGAGAVIWGALVIGLWSISTADPLLLAGWWLGQTLELAVAGYVIGSALTGTRLRRLVVQVGLLMVIGVGSAVLLQSIGYATAPVLVSP